MAQHGDIVTTLQVSDYFCVLLNWPTACVFSFCFILSCLDHYLVHPMPLMRHADGVTAGCCLGDDFLLLLLMLILRMF